MADMVRGISTVVRNLERMSKDIETGARKARLRAAMEIEREAVAEVPVDTGRLKGSISTQEVGDIMQVGSGVKAGSEVEYACIYGARTSVYSPDNRTSSYIGSYKYDDVLCKDGSSHRIEKKHRFYQKCMDLIKITAHSRRKPLIVTANHLILTLRDTTLCWIEAKELKLTDMVFTKRSHNAITDNSNKTEFTCVCGKSFLVLNSQLGSREPKYCSLECRHKYGPHDQATGKKWKLTLEQREKKCGENNSQWRGGKSKEPYDWRFNKVLKEKIRHRDGNMCKICGDMDNLVVHHKDSNKMNSVEDNLITLCRHCHALVTHKKLACELPDVNLHVFKPIPIKQIENISVKKEGSLSIGFLYDFSINNENSYYAGGLLIHNSYVEFGTSKQAAHPFLTPAVELVRAKYPDMIISDVEAEIK